MLPPESSPGKRKPPWQARQTEGLTVRKEKVSLVLMNWRTSKSCQRIHPDFGDLVGFSWGKQKSPDTWYIYNNSYEIYMYVNCKYILYMGKSTTYIYSMYLYVMYMAWKSSRPNKSTGMDFWWSMSQRLRTWSSWVYTKNNMDFLDLYTLGKE